MAANPVSSPNYAPDVPGPFWDGPLIRRITPAPGPVSAPTPSLQLPPESNIGTAAWLAGNGRKAFAHKVQEAAGQLSLPFLDKVNDDGYWVDHPMGRYTAENGHYYLAINSIGHVNGTTPAGILDQVGTNISDLFPCGGSSGAKGSSLKVGDHLRLTYWWMRWSSNVRVVYRGPWFFVLRTMRMHPLDGIAIHGIFQDASPKAGGKYWMFQEGFGTRRTPDKTVRIWGYDVTINEGKPLLGQFQDTTFNYFAARRMWKKFAENTRKFLGARD